MVSRICPTCNAHLGEYDNYFCSTCGNELPEKLSKLPGTIKIREYNSLQPLFNLKRKAKSVPAKEEVKEAEPTITRPVHKKLNFNQKMAMVLFLVISLLIVFFALFYFYLRSHPVTPLKTNQVQNTTYKKMLNFKLSSKPVVFDELGGVSFAPASTAFYADIADFEYFHENLLSAELLGMDLGQFVKLKTLIKPNGFSTFAFEHNDKLYWVGVFTPKSASLVNAELKDFKSTKFKARLIGDKLVVFQNNASDDVIKTIEGVQGGQVLKISLNPDFVKGVTDLSPQGQMRVVVLDANQSTASVTALSEKYFSSKNDLFLKLLSAKLNAFVVGTK